MPANSRFKLTQTFEITQDGQPFCDLILRYHNLDRQRMLVLENTIVGLVMKQNDLEQPDLPPVAPHHV